MPTPDCFRSIAPAASAPVAGPACCDDDAVKPIRRPLFFDPFERRFRRTANHLAGRLEPGTVARTIPGTLGAVPFDGAAHVRARGGQLRDGAVGVAICSDGLAAKLE